MFQFHMTIMKEINGNWEFQMALDEKNLCDHISEKNKPWTPFVDEMGIKGCPIPQVYIVSRNHL